MGITTRPHRLGQAITIILLLAAGLVSTVAAAPPAAAQDGEGPDSESDSRVVALEASYEVLPDDERIEVSETITIRNVRGSTRSGNIVTDYFWTGHTVWIAPDAEDISIASNGGELTYELVDEVEGLVKVYSVDFPSNLFFGQTRVLEVSYVLPSYLDSDGPRRINGAFFDFELITCCNFEEITIDVRAPIGFILSPPEDGGFTEDVSGDEQVWSYYDSEVSGAFTDYVVSDWFGLDFDGFDLATVSLGGADAQIMGYPDDPAWVQDMTTVVETVSGSMRGLTGNSWLQEPPEFQQARDNAAGAIEDDGKAAWLPNDNLVFVPSTVPTRSIALSVARGYVTESNFDLGWMTEATVRDMASQALSQVPGESRSNPSPPSGRIDGPEEGFWFVRQITDEIGYEGLLELERLAGTSETAFIGAGAPEQSATIDNDWRRLLDLAERRMGMSGMGLLMESTVLNDAQSTELTDRMAAIERYDELSERVGIDDGPVGMRDALTNWQFDDVNELIDAANAALDDAQAVTDEARDANLDFEPDMLTGWADHATVADFESLTDGFDDRRDAIDDIVATEARLDEERGYVSSLGFDEPGAQAAVSDARAAFDDGDLDRVDDSLANFATIEADASSSGRSKLITRLILPIAVGLLLLIGALWFFLRRRKAKDVAADPEAATASIDLTTAPRPPAAAGTTVVAATSAAGTTNEMRHPGDMREHIIDLTNAPSPPAEPIGADIDTPAAGAVADLTNAPPPPPMAAGSAAGTSTTPDPDLPSTDDDVVEF